MFYIEIKELEIDELEEARNVIQKSFETVAKEYGLTIDNCKTNAAFITRDKLISDKVKSNLMFGLFCNDKLVGFMQLKKKNQEIYILENLSVLPEFRHIGLGKNLLNFAKDKVKTLYGTKIRLGYIEENITLKNWYIRNGFVFKGIKKFKNYPYRVGFMEYSYEKVNSKNQ